MKRFLVFFPLLAISQLIAAQTLEVEHFFADEIVRVDLGTSVFEFSGGRVVTGGIVGVSPGLVTVDLSGIMESRYFLNSSIVRYGAPGTRGWSETSGSPIYFSRNFSQGAEIAFNIDLFFPQSANYAMYQTNFSQPLFLNGATPGINYVGVSFDGNDGVFEGIAKFDFTSSATGGASARLLSLARSTDDSSATIAGAIAAIDLEPVPIIYRNISIPEPSTLMLGCFSLMIVLRRKRGSS